MNKLFPVYTLQNECHYCYKCVRLCPVKAIRIEDGSASVISENCIACGNCAKICPQSAKKIRDDRDIVTELLDNDEKVIISIAPSWLGYFDYTNQELINVLKQLGFYGVSETALGAEEVSIATKNSIATKPHGLYISSACPAIVMYTQIYMPKFSKNIVSLASPALTHAQMLLKKYDDVKVVFVGPCTAKKIEADEHPDLITASLTFEEIESLIQQKNIIPQDEEVIEHCAFIPEQAHEGCIYPLTGGMNETMKMSENENDVQLLSISSINAYKNALENFTEDDLHKTVFLEALCCEGGCINGPVMKKKCSTISIMSKIMENTPVRETVPEQCETVLELDYEAATMVEEHFYPEEIVESMAQIGKYNIEDELNCGSCGYDNCRGLAKALLSHKAEPSMCISYMHKIAMKKAGAMFKHMPSGVVMVNSDLKIIEANESFVKMFAYDLFDFFSTQEVGITGASIDKMLPCGHFFKKTLLSGQDIHREHYAIEKRLYDITVFIVEPNLIAGAVITDVTKSELKRDQIAKRAQDVINKNITTVQNIACLLGEHMVDTETLLSSIAEGFERDDDGEEELENG